MGLFLYIAGSANPTEASVYEVLHCEGVNNKSYACETGHCCGESQCCSYYYELWWFWLVWAIIFILSCCCVCHHRHTKHRLQQQQRQHEINLIAYREVHNYTSLPFYFRFLPNNLLPDYEEAVHRPATPPPPYSALNAGPPTYTSPLTTDQQDVQCAPRQTTPLAPESDTLCSRPNIEDIHTSNGYHQKEDGKGEIELEGGRSAQSTLPLEQPPSMDKQNECRKEPLRNVAMPDEKERILGRHRRFTGDSGIEVCVCGQCLESHEPKEFEGLLSEEDQEDSFCEECGLHSHGEESQGLLSPENRVERGASPVPQSQPHPVCLYLHTINEQEGPQHSNTESQS
ncbi:WW domain binding protein 1-like isoform X2 [Sinocyclocheilus anshuiensis]|uniref:WW domain binding protein 1-like isoform X2 n=1 Tax=Sinocyclocheilus anshuiensis TaxID=1608454 RepID=UPI0007BA426A|nr:PREDICTED: WW domain binding protein 1-like isoform X2 [Sinocyclocheilus anshuiensis]